jgi:hypothetical protein
MPKPVEKFGTSIRKQVVLSEYFFNTVALPTGRAKQEMIGASYTARLMDA